MLTAFSLLLFLIFFTLALLHFYWAAGGRWGFDIALPKDNEGNKLMQPGAIASLIVGFGLLLMSLFYLDINWSCDNAIFTFVKSYAGWAIAGIFLLRAIGDFRIVGLFKKIRHTDFGKMDSKFYSPLCLLISILAIVIELFK